MSNDALKFYDLGEDKPIHPSKDSLAKILDAVIRLRGKITCSHCNELGSDGNYRYPRAACAVLFRIALPLGNKVRFEELTGFKLTEPPKIGIN